MIMPSKGYATHERGAGDQSVKKEGEGAGLLLVLADFGREELDLRAYGSLVVIYGKRFSVFPGAG